MAFLDQEAAIVYGKRDNIGVPGLDPSDTTDLAAVGTAAAARETARGVTKLHTSGTFQPDQADYFPTGSERG